MTAMQTTGEAAIEILTRAGFRTTDTRRAPDFFRQTMADIEGNTIEVKMSTTSGRLIRATPRGDWRQRLEAVCLTWSLRPYVNTLDALTSLIEELEASR